MERAEDEAEITQLKYRLSIALEVARLYKNRAEKFEAAARACLEGR